MRSTKKSDPTGRELTLVEDEIRSSDTHELVKQVEQLQSSHNNLASKVSELRGGTTVIGFMFTVISIVFAVLSSLAGYNIYKYQKFEARYDLQESSVDSLQNKIDDTIDRLRFVDPADRQSYRLNELADLQKRLKRLSIESDRFDNRSDLADATMLVIDNKSEEALLKLETLKKRTVHSDPFVYSRALTLHAIILVRPDRECQNPAIKPLVEEAVKRDTGLASAYNILGLCLTDEATEMAKEQSEEVWLRAAKKMQEAIKYYELSYALKPSAWALSKSLNNKVWGNLVFFESALGNEVRMKQHLALNGYANFEHFVNDSLRHLALCKELSPNQAVWFETEAELQGLRHAHYEDKNSETAKAALVEMKNQYRQAIKGGLFANQRFRDQAVGYFKSDTLLKKLHDDREILELIEKSVDTGM